MEVNNKYSFSLELAIVALLAAQGLSFTYYVVGEAKKRKVKKILQEVLDGGSWSNVEVVAQDTDRENEVSGDIEIDGYHIDIKTGSGENTTGSVSAYLDSPIHTDVDYYLSTDADGGNVKVYSAIDVKNSMVRGTEWRKSKINPGQSYIPLWKFNDISSSLTDETLREVYHTVRDGSDWIAKNVVPIHNMLWRQ